jgi:hypothetical protein
MCNYGGAYFVLDYLFGTYRAPVPLYPVLDGTKLGLTETTPEDIIKASTKTISSNDDLQSRKQQSAGGVDASVSENSSSHHHSMTLRKSSRKLN